MPRKIAKLTEWMKNHPYLSGAIIFWSAFLNLCAIVALLVGQR